MYVYIILGDTIRAVKLLLSFGWIYGLQGRPGGVGRFAWTGVRTGQAALHPSPSAPGALSLDVVNVLGFYRWHDGHKSGPWKETIIDDHLTIT